VDRAKKKHMKKNTVLILCALLLALCVSAGAQQPKKIPRIGYLVISSVGGSASRLAMLRQGLRDLGYVEGKNIILEIRSADGNQERGTALAEELVHLQVDVIVSGGSGATRPLKEATKTIPVVMAQDDDPVGNGVVASLARPGGNITGLSNFRADLSGKRLELLKEIAPRISRVAVMANNTEVSTARVLKETELAAQALRLKLQQIDVPNANEIEPAFRAANKGRAEAILMMIGGPILNSHGSKIRALAVKNRLPAMYARSNDVEAGGLASYNPNTDELFRRAATYVDKILKGAKLADLPVEQPTKFEFVINLKTAKQIGVTIPPDVLARASRLIK
jgi:putative tryptophan/tyrosine transport system substrate-binding protein